MKLSLTNTFVISLLLILFSCKPKQQTVTNKPPPIDSSKTAITTEVKEEPKKENKPEPIELSFSFLMPFDFTTNLAEDTSDLQQYQISANSIPWLHFYEGCKLAADSFSNGKLKFHFTAFDSADSLSLLNNIKGNVLYENKLLFAAVPQWASTKLSANAIKNNSMIVYPQLPLQNSANSVILPTSNGVLISEMCKWIVRSQSENNIIILYRKKGSEMELADAFASQIDSLRTSTLKCKKLDFGNIKFSTIVSSLDLKKNNLILITSSDEAFISSFTSQLSPKSEDYKLMLCGLPTWEGFETIEATVLEQLNTHIFSGTWIDYSNPEIISFEKKFIETFKAEPQPTAYEGFYLVKGMALKTKDSLDLFSVFTQPEFKNNFFNFQKSTLPNCFVNHHISILKYKDYKLVKVN